MYRTSVKYENFNGVEKERTLYFNLTKAELTDMKFSTSGDLEEQITEILKRKDHAAMLELFEDLIARAYGEKSDDGEYFIKNEDVFNKFKYSNAYDAFIEKIFGSDEVMEGFMYGILPKDIADEARNNKDIQSKLKHIVAENVKENEDINK